MNKVKVADDISPLAVFLVKSGSKGDRLLFRYPYSTEEKKKSFTKRNRKSPYSLIIAEDPLNAPRSIPGSEISDHKLAGFSDKVLSNLFAVKPELCGQKFELKVNDVRFVGHPTVLSTPTKREPSSVFMFNIVFALKANASFDVVSCYHDFTHRLAIAFQHEENRCSYFSTQARLMMTAHDEVATMAEADIESPYHLILSRCQLARDLQTAFQDLTNTGIVRLQIQKWIEVSFCLPHKVHCIHNNSFTIGPEAIKTCLNALRPYHGFLLLFEVSELLEALPQDASPALIRLIHVASPFKSLQQLSADADLTLTQVFQLAGHLIYWAKATVIYPLCGNNIYIISPNASTSVNSPLVDKFAEKFPGRSIIHVLSEFSLPVSLSQLSSPIHFPYEQVQHIKMVVWMLQHRLLMQLHKYVYLIAMTHSQHDQNGEKSPSQEDKTNEQLLSDKISSLSEFGSSISSEEFMPSIQNQNLIADQSKSISEDEFSERNSPPGGITLSHLSRAEKNSLLKIPASRVSEDLRLFARLSKYFKGEHHLEEIMYCENVGRSKLCTLLDKFHDILIMCQHEDAAVAAFYKQRM